MGRTEHGESARDRLLAAADELFYRGGITSTGVDAVISRAQVAIGSLYNNFGGKDGLVAAYLEARDHRWRQHWESCIAEHDDPVARVLAIFTAMERWAGSLVANRGCAQVAAAMQLETGSTGIEVAAAHKRHLVGRLQELVTATDVRDPGDVAQDVLIVYEGMFSLLVMDLDADPIGRARRLAAARLGEAIAEAGRDPDATAPG